MPMRADSELTWDHSSSSSDGGGGGGGGGGGLANPFSLSLFPPLHFTGAPLCGRPGLTGVQPSVRLLSLLASGGEKGERSGRSYVRAQKRSPARAIAAAEAKARDGRERGGGSFWQRQQLNERFQLPPPPPPPPSRLPTESPPPLSVSVPLPSVLRPSQASRKARLRSAGAADAAADAAPRSRSTATGEGRLIGATGLVPCAAEHAKSRAPSVRLCKI